MACIKHGESDASARIDREFFKNPANMGTHSPVAYLQSGSYLFVSQTFEQQMTDFAFSEGKIELLLKLGS